MDKPKSIYEQIIQAENDATVQDIVTKENSRRIRVHMPAKVVAVNGPTVDVEIQGSEDTGLGYFSGFPLLLDLPLVYNNYTNSAYIITPVQVGDTGLVEFLDFNTSNFNNNGNTALTSDSYYHSLNNGVFINGFIPNDRVFNIRSKNTKLTSKANNPTMLAEPNLDLYDRPKIQNPDGTYSTTVSVTIGIEINGKECLAVIPTVYDGKHHSLEEATEHFYKTKEHFGIFSNEDPQAVEEYSTNVHNAQAQYVAGQNTALTMGLHNECFTLYTDDMGNLMIETLNEATIKSGLRVNLDTPEVNCTGTLGCKSGASGSFQAGNKTVSVSNGIITSIE